MKRHTEPLRISSTARSSLGSSRHGAVDAVLKDLKNYSRRLNVALSAFTDEYRVLERLYYKGKNQHRLSLFWRRVTEIRRFCDRFDGLHIDQAVDTLRASFFSGEDVSSNPKMMRGSWTHLPNVLLVDLVLRRLYMGSALLEKMQAKLLDSYRSFTLAMQSGAFLQLIVILVAVASRMRAICEELQEVLQTTTNTARRLHEILSASTISTEMISLSSPEVAVDSSIVVGAEGSSMPQLTEVIKPSPKSVDTIITVERNVEQAKTSAKVKKSTKDREASRSKKRQKPKDEIDDIFGF